MDKTPKMTFSQKFDQLKKEQKEKAANAVATTPTIEKAPTMKGKLIEKLQVKSQMLGQFI